MGAAHKIVSIGARLKRGHATMADAIAPESEVANDTMASRTSLGELEAFFLRLGLTAFGGPAAHVAIMEDELVRLRRWLSRESFLDLLGASNLIPGPSFEQTGDTHRVFAGRMDGAAVARWCFILPAAIIVVALAWLCVRFGALPVVSAILYAVKPVVIAVGCRRFGDWVAQL
jgi:chromate transporter